MTNDISKTTGTAIATAAAAANPFLAYGEKVTARNIVGKLLKFSKGDYTAGEANDEIAVGTRFVACMDQLLIGWIRWENNRPTEHIMGLVTHGYQPPARNTLGDNDEALWEYDASGKEQRDPWQKTNYLLLRAVDDTGLDADPAADPESGLYTFTTSSVGGLNAIGLLCRKYGQQFPQHMHEYPVIALGVGSYNHGDYGKIKFPVLDLVGWAAKSVFEAGVTEVRISDPVPTGPSKAAKAEAAAPPPPAPKPAPKPQKGTPFSAPHDGGARGPAKIAVTPVTPAAQAMPPASGSKPRF